MATKRTNYAKAQVWLTDMKVECEGTISAVCVRLFECIGDTAVRAKVLKVLRVAQETALHKAKPAAPEPEFHSSDWWEAVWSEEERVSQEVEALVNAMTANLPQAMDDALRERLNENFRFWRN